MREKGKINLLIKSEERMDNQMGEGMWHIWVLRSPGTQMLQNSLSISSWGVIWR